MAAGRRWQMSCLPVEQSVPACLLTDNCDAPERCRVCAIRQGGICSALAAVELNRLSRIAHRRSYQPGQVILRSDDKPAFWAGVVSGVVKLTKLLADGRQQIVDLLFPADFVGRPFSKQTPYYAEAAVCSELCCFRIAEFESMLDEHPHMKQHLFEHTLDKLDNAHDWMVALGRKTAEERVASLLYHLVTRARLAGPSQASGACVPSFELHLKREEMACFLGLTYETVIRQIKALEGQGIITLNSRREFGVPDLPALRRAAG
ncbi:MAG: Crp/Fnr family transcriptional regulator [Hyphomicrobiaceae bacterium]|nr:MAG: Crp/Fnr family transcriptional regulator [Hyphomicrobiaceae bacterium]